MQKPPYTQKKAPPIRGGAAVPCSGIPSNHTKKDRVRSNDKDELMLMEPRESILVAAHNSLLSEIRKNFL